MINKTINKMKNIIKISTLLAIIIATIFTACKKDIIQTDKPLYDVLINKTWHHDFGTSIYFWKDSILFYDRNSDCDVDTTQTFHGKWYLDSDTIFLQDLYGHYDDYNHFIDTAVETYHKIVVYSYSEKKIVGKISTYPPFIHYKDAEFRVCEKK